MNSLWSWWLWKSSSLSPGTWVDSAAVWDPGKTVPPHFWHTSCPTSNPPQCSLQSAPAHPKPLFATATPPNTFSPSSCTPSHGCTVCPFPPFWAPSPALLNPQTPSPTSPQNTLCPQITFPASPCVLHQFHGPLQPPLPAVSTLASLH